MKKTTQLKNLLHSDSLELIMEAHNGLSAKIVEETGFKGIWGSGLAISASMGVRDNNELSWSQVLDILAYMSDVTTIPILLDGDTGYGNFNNARRLVKKLEQIQVAGVCIEDKLFPKTNSFISGEKQPLADMDEFCGKIKAMKDSQTDEDFIVVSRVEAFIAGWGLTEALRRAEAYRQAGTDAILIHSKRNDISEVEAFVKEWANRLPVVIVPTKYYSVPTDRFLDLEISLVIWANHNLRSSITAMQQTSNKIFNDKSLINIEGKVASLREVFRLQGAEELAEAEKKYLPTAGKTVKAIILAASQGDLQELTSHIPKTLLKVNGKSLLAMQVEDFNGIGIKDIWVVRGFAKEKIAPTGFQAIDNDVYAATKELYSLYLARDKINETTLISYGDIMFKNYILYELLNDSNDITLIVDADWELAGTNKDFVATKTPYSKKLYSKPVLFSKMSSTLIPDEINGEFIGLWKISHNGAAIVKDALEHLAQKPDFNQMTLADLFNHISLTHPIAVIYVRGSWLDVDTIPDLQKAGEKLC